MVLQSSLVSLRICRGQWGSLDVFLGFELPQIPVRIIRIDINQDPLRYLRTLEVPQDSMRSFRIPRVSYGPANVPRKFLRSLRTPLSWDCFSSLLTSQEP